uniref:Ig-like domain-containing protein n=1 Tax=Anas platyrhynchos TaxID=8839 RepID=A0A8B9R016_ANAPL
MCLQLISTCPCSLFPLGTEKHLGSSNSIWVINSAVVSGTVQGDEIQPTRTTVWGQAGQTETLQCTYSSNASYIYVAWYRQHPNGSLQYLLQSKGRGASRDNSRSESSLFLQHLHVGDSARYFCAIHTGTGNPTEL